MNIPDIIYEKDDFSDILKKDDRFDSRAYDFVLEVINEACSEARNNTACATSSGVPKRLTGVSSTRVLNVSASSVAFISVWMTPGSTQLTVIPEGPSSLAMAMVKPRMAALVAE